MRDVKKKINCEKITKKKSFATNKFMAIIQISIPKPTKDELNRWLNIQHIGRETIVSDEKFSSNHKSAIDKMNLSRTIIIQFELCKDGSWKFNGKNKC